MVDSQNPLLSLVPYKYTIEFVSPDVPSLVTTDTTYPVGKVLAEYVYPRADGFASFAV
jgi:hypothetical protein